MNGSSADAEVVRRLASSRLSWVLDDIWAYYVVAFVVVGWAPLLTQQRFARPSIHEFQPTDATALAYWIGLGVVAAITCCAALIRRLQRRPGEDGKAPRTPYPIWYAVAFAALGLPNAVYVAFPLREHLAGYGLLDPLFSGGYTVIQPTFALLLIDLGLAAAVPFNWIGRRLDRDREDAGQIRKR